MTVVTLSAAEYAQLLKGYPCIQAPVAIGGYLYAVVQGDSSDTVYRVAIA